jgi:antitoxin component of MazEF toxin-antitoxin module
LELALLRFLFEISQSCLSMQTAGEPASVAQLHGIAFSPGLEAALGSRQTASVLTARCYRTDMSKRLTRSGNSLALVIDRPLLDALEIDSETELELSTDGDVLIVTPLRDRRRKKRTADLVAEAHDQYGGVFRRLAE